MARLVTKFKYLKVDQEKPIGGYATYIATREGVEKIDESFKLAPATVKQQKLIEKILGDFPDSATMLEYEDYKRDKTVGAASEFITRAIEDNAHEILNQKTYADYIGTRPGAERFGSHGLFTDDGVQVKLKEVSQELNAHQSGKCVDAHYFSAPGGCGASRFQYRHPMEEYAPDTDAVSG
ncbi:hypothetical protein [Faecalitalea cylindroides]